MNFLKETISASLLSGGLFLTGVSAANAAPPVSGSSLAQTLGLPVDGKLVHFWNEATQTSGRVGCDTYDDHVRCKLDISSAGGQVDFKQVYTLAADTAGTVRVTADEAYGGSWQGDYRQTTSYRAFYQKADNPEWSAQSPLAVETPAGLLQGKVKMVEAVGGNSARISSDVPVSENFGIRLTQVFDGADYTFDMSATPRAFFGGAEVVGEEKKLRRAMIGYDDDILKNNLRFAQENGGTGFRAVTAQRP